MPEASGRHKGKESREERIVTLKGPRRKDGRRIGED